MLPFCNANVSFPFLKNWSKAHFSVLFPKSVRLVRICSMPPSLVAKPIEKGDGQWEENRNSSKVAATIVRPKLVSGVLN